MLSSAAADATPEAAALIAWYDLSRRDLPWRAPPGIRPDPYGVWLSEIMLQQTTVAAVKPYFATFMARWPTVGRLAAAPLDDVLSAWAGLGYYSRARNLHACAKQIIDRLDGCFPADEAALRALPGIGQYTAAAIAAIAFGQRATVVDGNVERVVARYFAVEVPLPAARTRLRQLADGLTPTLRPGDYAQAMMDLGATVCTPRNPDCDACPLAGGCAARARGIAADLPRRAAKAERPLRRGAAFVARRTDGAVLVERRPAKGLLGGMLGLPGTDWATGRAQAPTAAGAPLAGAWRPAGGITHVFTHFRLELDVFAATCPAGQPAPAGMDWQPAAAARAALPTVMKKAFDRGITALD